MTCISYHLAGIYTPLRVYWIWVSHQTGYGNKATLVLDFKEYFEYTPRTAVEKYWIFYYEWQHPGEQEAIAQNLEFVNGV